MKSTDFELDMPRLAQVMTLTSQALERREGIFGWGFEKYLPQWRLPKELEYSPMRRQVKDPEAAAKYLFTKNYIDRISLSKFIIKNTTRTWYDKDSRWIFEPKEVIKRDAQEVGKLLKDKLFYAVPVKPTMTAGEGYLRNAQTLMAKYNGDPRQIINGRTVSQAQSELENEFEGIGRGLANLIISEFASREIAQVSDPYNISLKIDRHKKRIPINTGVVQLSPVEGEVTGLHSQTLTQPLEEAYRKIAQERGLNILDVDAALWIIGSEVCGANKEMICQMLCPFYHLCGGNSRLDHYNGFHIIYDTNGRRIDTRQGHNLLDEVPNSKPRKKAQKEEIVKKAEEDPNQLGMQI